MEPKRPILYELDNCKRSTIAAALKSARQYLCQQLETGQEIPDFVHIAIPAAALSDAIPDAPPSTPLSLHVHPSLAGADTAFRADKSDPDAVIEEALFRLDHNQRLKRTHVAKAAIKHMLY